MNFEWNKKTTYAMYALIVILLSIAGVFIFLRWDNITDWISNIVSVAMPLVYAMGIAYLLWPILRFLETKILYKLEKKKPRKKLIRTISVTITMIIFLAILALFLWAIIPQITDSIITLKDKAITFFNNIDKWFNRRDFKDNKTLALIAEYLEIDTSHISDYIKDGIEWVVNNTGSILSGVTSFTTDFALEIKNILLGIVFSVYFLIFKEQLFAQVSKLVRSITNEKIYNKLTHYTELTDRTFGGFISGKILDSFIIGILCFICMLIFKMPYAALISLIVGVTNVIPFFGPFIGAIPSTFIILIADPGMTLWFLLLILAIQQFDGNILGPKILGDFLGLSSLWVIISITLMGGLLGIFGMFLGVPTFAVIYSIVKENTEAKLQTKDLVVETSEYYKDKAYLEIVQKPPKEKRIKQKNKK